jgi:hypothetical protein
MDFSSPTFLPSILFGLVGMGFFGYGKKLQKGLHMLVGIGLMVVPYFVTGLMPMVMICCVLTILPFARELI